MLYAFPYLQQAARLFGVLARSVIQLDMIALNQWITYGYYAMTFFFTLALAWNLWKSKNPQESILYVVILIPFVLRLLRVK